MTLLLRSALVLFAVIGISFASPRTAHAAPPAESFTLEYSMYTSGFQAMRLRMDFAFDGKTYSGKMSAKPYGLLGHLLPWAGTYTVNGIIDAAGELYPTRHVKLSEWRDDMDRYSMVYKDRTLTSVTVISEENGKTGKQRTLSPERALHENSVDIMTASLRLMAQMDKGGDCDTSSIVFDGKRRFKLAFSDKGDEQLKASRLNIYDGNAHLCEIEMIPLKGYKKKPTGYYKIQEEARKRGQMPRVWMAQAWAGGRYVPVRLLVKSEFGGVFVHLRKITRHATPAKAP